MNIVMLGHSAAGKTSYLSLMYAAMCDGVEGLTLGTADPAAHRSLVNGAGAILRGSYPRASDRRQAYEFVLRHQGADVFPFRWTDHRGGALTELRSASAQARQLHEDLVAAQGIVLFVDALHLATDPEAPEAVRRLIVRVHQAVDAREETLTPLVIALTKTDLVDLGAPGGEERFVGPFLPLIEAVAGTRHIQGAFIPLVCGPEPENVVLPVLWTLRFGILGRAMELSASIERLVASAQYADARDTVWDRIGSWWTDQPSWASMRDRARAEAAGELARLQPLVAPADRLAELLEDVLAF
ncbi:hypothetical protein GCM10009665_27660 [Kitasatospora nipponensis]|uniref:Double-GTPase 1 domain-containing protein n=1 Tax=Kitasatospora nipponensis TaxID=258049 RepID=A0ABN1W5A3_9ACTN